MSALAEDIRFGIGKYLCSVNSNRFIKCMYIKLLKDIPFFISFTLYPAQQGTQSEPSVKIFRSPLSAKFWRHWVLSGGT